MFKYKDLNRAECKCKKCLDLIDENHIINCKICKFCGHYCINRRDGKPSCDCEESIKELNKNVFI